MVIGKSVKAVLLELSAQIAGAPMESLLSSFLNVFMACTILECSLMSVEMFKNPYLSRCLIMFPEFISFLMRLHTPSKREFSISHRLGTQHLIYLS